MQGSVNSDNPKVSIVCTTYNQEKYIAEALDSFIMQETNFPFEVIVGEDCSTDNTRKIVQDYATKYPEIIKPIYQEINTGGFKNLIDTMNACRGEYFIINEGDDFFTDKHKLQVQVDYLDKNPNSSMCFHPVKVFFQDKSAKDYIFPTKREFKITKGKFNYETLKKVNFIQTNSCMFRRDTIDCAELLPNNILPGDYFINLYYSRKGEIGFINKVMSSYRRQAGGIWQSCYTDPDKHCLKYGLEKINLYYQASNRFIEDRDYWYNLANREYNKVLGIYLKLRAWDKVELAKKLFPELSEENKYTDDIATNLLIKKSNHYKNLFNIFLPISIFLLLANILLIYLVFAHSKFN